MLITKFMKRLYIVRHSKSDWDDLTQQDIDRPLNSRGHRDAPNMAELLMTKNYIPNHIITSPANRAKSTAAYFISCFGTESSETADYLYHGDIDDIINACIGCDEKHQSLMLFCHNPGITYFANVICDANIMNVPTTGVLVIDADTDAWENIDMSKLKLVDFLYPKKLA